MSDCLPCPDIHKRLFETLDSAYDQCWCDGSDLFVKMKSPEIARQKRGSIVKVGESDYTLEFAGHHSTMYACNDVKGASEKELLEAIDYPDIASNTGIGLARQLHNGPYVAFMFDTPLMNCLKFTLRVGRNDLEFTPAQSQCPLCTKRHNGAEWNCDQLEIKSNIVAPGGYWSNWHELLKRWGRLFESRHDLVVGEVFRSEHWQYERIKEFKRKYPALKAEVESARFRCLGISSEKSP